MFFSEFPGPRRRRPPSCKSRFITYISTINQVIPKLLELFAPTELTIGHNLEGSDIQCCKVAKKHARYLGLNPGKPQPLRLMFKFRCWSLNHDILLIQPTSLYSQNSQKPCFWRLSKSLNRHDPNCWWCLMVKNYINPQVRSWNLWFWCLSLICYEFRNI